MTLVSLQMFLGSDRGFPPVALWYHLPVGEMCNIALCAWCLRRVAFFFILALICDWEVLIGRVTLANLEADLAAWSASSLPSMPTWLGIQLKVVDLP